MRRATSSVAAVTMLMLAAPAARAQEAVATAAPPPPAGANHFQLRLEAAGGSDGPVGHLGAVALAGQDWWELGLGYGRHLDSSKPDRYAVLGRLRLLRSGGASLWATASGSWGYRMAAREYARPGYDEQSLNVWWDPATRVSAGAIGRYQAGRFHVFVEAGAGYNVNAPHCTVNPPDVPCDAPEVKAAYGDLAPFEPGRFTPYAMAGLGMDLLTYADDGARDDGGADAGVSARPADPRAVEGFLAPTALTQPAGSWTFTSRELLYNEVSYGISNRFQASVGGALVPQDENGSLTLVNASVKAGLLRVGRLRLAALADAITTLDSSNNDGLVGVGPIATLVLDRAGDSTVSVAAIPGVGFRRGGADAGAGFDVLFTASAIIGLVDHVKLVGEIFDRPGARWQALAGARFYYGGFSLDLGATRDSGSSELLPVGVLSYRLL